VIDQPVEQRNLAIALAHQRVAQQMGDRQRAQRANGIDEQRVRPIERVNVAAAIAVRDQRAACTAPEHLSASS